MLELYPFQQLDVEKLRLVTARLIANEMGTGKTFEAIALDMESPGRTLVVAPLSTLYSPWTDNYHLYHPHRKITVIDPRDRQPFLDELNKGNQKGVFITHWESLRLNGMERLAQETWGHVIADEVHKIRNHRTQLAKALKRIPAKQKTALTGTPIVNGPADLWSILNWLYPEQFPSLGNFLIQYTEVDHRYKRAWYQSRNMPRNSRRLRRKIRHFYVRHRKSAVLSQLPPKYYTNLVVPLHPKQRKAYDQMRLHTIAWLDNQEKLTAPGIFAKLVRLQQLAVAYHNGETAAEPSSKIDALMEILDDTQRPVAVFSSFRQVIALVEQRLSKTGIEYVRIVGDDSAKERSVAVRKFATGTVPVFLGTIGAGSEGISLTAADTCVFLDRTWTPADGQQAEDRLHRAGQKNAVQVISINAKDTIDQYKQTTRALKRGVVKQMLLH